MTHVILFDIDMTLLYSGGAGGLAMRQTFEKLYGVDDAFARVEFSGRTDWSILHTAMEQHGVLDGGSGGATFEREMGRFQETYYGLLAHTLNDVEGGRVMPGVLALLKALSNRDGVGMGLATGNFRHSAFMKLTHFGLDGYLNDGGFGDDAEERSGLVGVGIERIAAGATPEAVWVIGDTPLDIAAAHANGALALGVATGPLTTEELLAEGAELALDDLSDTDAVVAALLNER